MKEKLENEEARQRSLVALDILDTSAEVRFDQFTVLATEAFGVPIALISLVDRDRQWFKSRVGLTVQETPRSSSFCAHAIKGTDTFIITDARNDERFADNPLVLGEPTIRFYAGHPICTLDGFAAGTLCIIDTKPRELTKVQVGMLQSLAKMVENELNRDFLVRSRLAAECELRIANANLEERVRDRTRELEAKNAALQTEIAQRERFENTLRVSEKRVRSIIDSSLSAFVAADANGKIIEWNRAAERVLGWSSAEVKGCSLSSTIIPSRHREAHEAGMAKVLNGQQGNFLNKILELSAKTKSGNEIVVEMSITTFVSDGQFYFGAFLNDVSERLRAKQLLEQKQELLDAVLDTVDVAVIACGADGNLSFFNRAAREFHGQQPGDVETGKWAEHYDLFRSDGTTPLEPQDIPLLKALNGEAVKDITIVIAPAGLKRRTVLTSGRMMTSQSGIRLGAVVAMHDITELNEQKQRLAANERMLRSITENLPILIGQVDKSDRFIFLNSRAAKSYGRSVEQLLGQRVRDVYSEEGYAQIEDHISAVRKGRRESFEFETTVGGKQFFHHASFVPNFNESGAPDGYFAMAFDISARRESEILLAQSEERLRTITDNLPVLISYLGNDLRYRFANAMYYDWLGVPGTQMLGKTPREVFGDNYSEEQDQGLSRAQSGTMSNIEMKINRLGHERTLSTTYIPHIHDGTTVGIYVLSTDSTAAREHEKQLLSLAHADPLTGLPNRRMYDFHLEKAFSLSKRQNTRMALMYLDLDRFKAINDTYGHAVGDSVLIEFGRRVGSAIRATDTLSRLAGDEFTVILESVGSTKSCEVIAKKIVLALSEPFLISCHELIVSASIGVALATNLSTIVSLGRDADHALYEAKDKGRNRYVVVEAGGLEVVNALCPGKTN